MLFKLLAAFILIPLIELYLLFRVADFTSPLTALLLVILTGVLGSILARREGALAWFRFQKALQDGRMPSREIQDGLMIVFAAALLLAPGLLTDGLGFLLLLPWGRDLIRKGVLKPYVSRVQMHFVGSSRQASEPEFDHDDSAERPRARHVTLDAKVIHRK
jgi:UPF0716 protein FxsA